MTTLTEGKRPGQFLLSEASFHRSRDTVTILSGSGDLAPGTVLGKILLGAATTAFAGTGNGAITMDAVTPVKAGAKTGAYKATLITAAANGGTFRVEDPDGLVLGDVAVGATFDDDIKFVIADGATDFVVGDTFTITVAAGSGKLAPTDLAAVDGREKAAAVLLYGVDATAADQSAVVIARDAEVKRDELAYHASVDLAAEKTAKEAELALAGIIVR